MENSYGKDKNLFMNYNQKYYEEYILNNKECNCFNCKNYKTGDCILLNISVTAFYVCPHFIGKNETIEY